MKQSKFYQTICGLLILIFFSFIAGAQQLEVMVRLDSYEGKYSPSKAAVLWIQTPDYDIVRTFALWSWNFSIMLADWGTISEPEDSIDAVTSATLTDTSSVISGVWDLKNYTGKKVPDGTYEFWVEFSEDEYWWQLLDTNEVYKGKTSWGTITIDGTEKTVSGDTAIPYFGDFTAHYNPISAITNPSHNRYRNNALVIRYDLPHREVTISPQPALAGSWKYSIFTMTGALIQTAVSMNRNACWNCRTTQGTLVTPGMYFIRVEDPAGIRRCPVQSIIIVP
jgi:hypothetical protein